MIRRLAIAGVTDESVSLVSVLEANPDVEIALVFAEDLEAARQVLASLPAELGATLQERLTDEPARLESVPDLFALIDAGMDRPARERFPRLARRGVRIVTPLTARLLFSHGASPQERKSELLQALHEIVESVDLTVDSEELFTRVLEVAVTVTGADGGSLMLLDPEDRTLRVVCALGVERELWPKIRVALGEGIAGRVAAEARPLWLRGRADHEQFALLRDRADVESSLCVPLVHEGRVLGVLNLHHSSSAEAFSEDDLEFAEELGRLDAEIIARAQEREALRSGASRYEAVREVREVLSGRMPLLERLSTLCGRVAARAGNGIATVYLFDADDRELRLAATSLAGGGFAGEYRVLLGQGIDGRVAAEGSGCFLRGEDGRLAYAALPLLDGDRLVGVLSVQSAEPARDASGSPLHQRALEEVLLEIAAAAADEIADSERETKLAARATQMNAINEAGIRLISCRDVGEVARLGTSSAALILAADHALLRLQDEGTRRYVIRSYYGSADGSFQEKLFRLDQHVSVDVIKRRSSLLVRDLQQEPAYHGIGAGVRSLLAAPLKHEGHVIGTLCLYEKVAADRFYPGSFNDEDLRVFARYVGYLERAVAHARFVARTRQQRRFDDQTGLPNANYLGTRIDQEVVRADGRVAALAVLGCQIENLSEIRAAAEPVRADRVVLRTAEVLQQQLRDFDVLARVADGEFAALLPDPGPELEERIVSVARAVADAIAKEDALNDPVRVALGFGYAVHPTDGSDGRALLQRAAQVRIRTV